MAGRAGDHSLGVGVDSLCSTLLTTVPRQGLPFYRQVKRHLAMLYDRYDLEPAGGSGLNVCIERDVWRWRKEILADDR